MLNVLKFFAVIVLGVCLAGCSTPEQNAAVLAYQQRFDSDWIKQNIIISQTTKEQIFQWYGKPLSKTSMMSSGIAGAIMPDEIWTYSVTFSQRTGHFGTYSIEQTTDALSVSFKNGVVSNVSTVSQ